MANPIIIKKFKELGLSPYEAKSYLSLLEKDTLTVSEIARLAKIPRANAYEALEKLLAKGFCVSKPGKVRQYSALDPAQLEEKSVMVLDQVFEGKLNKLYEKQDEILAEKKEARKRLSELSRELSPLYNNSRSNETPMDFIEIIKDSYQIGAKFNELVSQSKNEVLVFSKPPYSVARKGLDEQSRIQRQKRKKENVKTRSIHEIPRDQEELSWLYQTFLSHDEGQRLTRVIAELPMKMAIFDEEIVLLPLEDLISSGNLFTAQIIRHPALAKSLKITFETLWEQAEDYHVLEDLLKKM